MTVNRSNVNVPFSEAVVALGKSCRQSPGAAEDFIEDRPTLAREMNSHDDGRGKIARKILGEKSQRLDAPRRRTNGQDVAIGHGKGCPFLMSKTTFRRYGGFAFHPAGGVFWWGHCPRPPCSRVVTVCPDLRSH